MKTILPYFHFFFNYEFQQSPYFELFFHSVHFNFINLKLEKNSCKKWCAGHRNICIFRSTFRVSPCTAVSCRLPSIQKTRGTSSCLLRERASKSRHLAPQKTKTNSAPWTSGSYLCWTTWSFSLPLILRCELHCFSWSKHYQRQNLNAQIQLSIIYWPSLHCNLGLNILLEREWRWTLGPLKQYKSSKLLHA